MEALIIILLCLCIISMLKRLGFFALTAAICHSPHFWPVMKWIFWIWLAVWAFYFVCVLLTGALPDEWISHWWYHRRDK